MNRSLVRPAACALAAAAFTLILLAVPASSPSGQTITLTGFGCSGTVAWNSASNTLTCQTSGGTFGCSSISASPSSAPLLTQAVTLTANCSNNVGSIVYTWTAAGSNALACPPISGASQASLVAPGGSTALSCTYNLSAFDTATTATASKTLSYSTTPPPPPPGGPDTSACTALGLTPKVITATWTGNTLVYTSNSGSFGPNDAVIVQFTIGGTASDPDATGNISAVEYNGPVTYRSGALSASPCDFTVGLPAVHWNATGTIVKQCSTTVISQSQTPSAGFTVATTPPNSSCAAVLDRNRTYFFNLTNFAPGPPPNGTQQCTGSACNMLITLKKPSGS